MKTNRISVLSRLLLILSAVALFIARFVPVWRIELAAPQYPEGLVLKIFANEIGGDVAIINGLNHYIGMKTLHTEDFIEFTILPYCIIVLGLWAAIAAIVGTKKWLYATFAVIALFGVVAMVDFWWWEYRYGHNLDPHAAIVVPGMAYQPPLLGFKQLLNFGAFSIPDLGGWLFVSAGLMLLIAVLKETGLLKKLKKNRTLSLVLLATSIATVSSCTDTEPVPVALNSDHCDNCRMTISQAKFAAELITQKGRIYKFDDVHCMLNFQSQNPNIAVRSLYVCDYLNDHEFMDATVASYISGDFLKSPMGGNTAAFQSTEAATPYAGEWNAEIIDWGSLKL